MRVLFRYLTLFVGIVATINGCNGLISSQYGTHRLRTLTSTDLITNGLGDADFIELTDVVIGSVKVENEAGTFFAPATIQRPLFSPEQERQYRKGATVAPLAILWSKHTAPAASPFTNLETNTTASIRGLITEPPLTVFNISEWNDNRLTVTGATPYIAYNKAPMAWYWNLVIFLGGLVLAVLPEARRFNQNKALE